MEVDRAFIPQSAFGNDENDVMLVNEHKYLYTFLRERLKLKKMFALFENRTIKLLCCSNFLRFEKETTSFHIFPQFLYVRKNFLFS